MTDLVSPENLHWTLDRKVPIGFILAIILQCGAILWWASGVDRHLAEVDRRMIELDAINQRQDNLVAERIRLNDARWESIYRDRDRIGQLETGVKFILEGVQRIENKVDKVVK